MWKRPVLDIVLKASPYAWSDAERDAASRPPYPLPRLVERTRARILAELDPRVPAVPEETWVTVRIAASRQPFAAAVAGLHRRDGFRLADAMCVLLAGGVLSLADVDRFASVAGVPSWSGLPRQVVHHHLAARCLDDADAAAAAMGDNAWRGYRDIALVLAERGDTDGVLGRWREVRPVKDRRSADRIRGALVRAVAERDGWRAALELTADARVGARFRPGAFGQFARAGRVGQLQELFAGEAAGILDEHAELSLLTHAIRVDSEPFVLEDHPALAGVLDRIVAIDPTVDKATMRVRDNLLFTCWYGTGDEATLRRIRSSLRTPFLRHELSMLYRDLPSVRPEPAVD